jgi:hypothetical protein
MTTSQNPFLSEILSGQFIPSGKRAYFQERLRNRIYSLILEEFVHKNEVENLTQKTLANRIGKGPDQINRWLSSPGNWTIDTISDILLGISGSELTLSITKIADQLPINLYEPNITQQSTGYIQIADAQSNILPFRTPYGSVSTTIPKRHPYPSFQLGA